MVSYFQRLRVLTTPQLRRSHQDFGAAKTSHTGRWRKIFGRSFLCFKFDEIVQENTVDQYPKKFPNSMTKTETFAEDSLHSDPPAYDIATNNTKF